MSTLEEIDSGPEVSTQENNRSRDTESNSSYSASDISDSLSSAQEDSSSRGRRKKRSFRANLTSSYRNVKRLKSSYSDKYCVLFNETLSDIMSSEIAAEIPLPLSQIGITLWSSEEKALFFSSITKRGRHDIRGIATDIGSKSESEVAIFIGGLQHAASEEQMYELAPKKLFKAYEIGASFEISEECCASLDSAAESLSGLQYMEEERLEAKTHGEFALLTPRIAKWIEGRLQTGKLGEAEILGTLPPARLLNLKMFLALSKRLFMNSSVMENNWRSYAERRKSPLIMHTAFLDFHNLAVSLTKRLIQSSLIFAMSRLKALDESGQYSSGRHVKRGDVRAALDVLGIDRNGRQTWARTARKCKLQVYDRVRYRKVSGKSYSYDEVEEFLSSQQRRGRGRSVSSDEGTPSVTIVGQIDSSESSATDEMSDLESSASLSVTDDDTSTLGSSDNLATNHRDAQASNDVPFGDPHDSYAEALDQRASQDEEQRLWELLGEHPANNMSLRRIPLPKALGSERKDRNDLVDWSDQAEHAQEWERYEVLLPASSFEETQRLGRKHNSVAGMATSGTGSGDVERETSTRPISSKGEPVSDGGALDETSHE